MIISIKYVNVCYITGQLYEKGDLSLRILMHPSGKSIKNIDEIPTSFNMANGFCARFKIDPQNLSAHDMFSYDVFTDHDIIISDSARSTYYVHSVGTSGPSISPEQHTIIHYSISFEEVHWLEQSGECAIYGDDAKFKTYADCVAKEHEDIFKPILGCHVPWLSAPAEPANCRGRIYLDNKTQFIHSISMIMLKALRTGRETTDCLKPCVEVLAQARLVRKRITKRKSLTTLTFERKARVTRHQRAYGPFELVVDFGSSLGLWIGLSAVGIVDLILQTGILVMQRVKNKY